MKKQQAQAFTLVELIVVITILAILGTIAFISLQGYSAQARDTTRVSDIQNIKTSLELFSLNTGKYPLPDSGTGVLYDTEIVWTQGTIGDNIITNLSRNLNKKPTDPLTETEYTYSVIGSQTKYELLSIYESDLVSYNNGVVLKTNAANANYPKISGNYNGIFVKTPTYYIPLPSIITSTDLSSGLTLTDGTVADQIITGGENNIAYGTSESVTGKLPDFKISSFSGIISTKNDDNKELLAQVLIEAYSGTLLANEGIYQTIIDTTDLISLVDNVVLSSSTYTSTSGGNDDLDETPVVTDWRTIDPNCDLPDVTIGDQIWAGCNSTLGTGIEFVSTQDSSCRNYEGTNVLITCSNTENLSTSKANAWFTGTNTNSDSEVDNIWGKLYVWSEASKIDGTGPCREGYSLPSDEDWYDLEVFLGSTDRSTNGEYSGIQDGRFSDGLGWASHTTKDETNNIIQALKLPLAGYRNSDGVTFDNRGFNTGLWSSTSSGTNAYNRNFHRNYSTVNRNSLDQVYGFSARCLKD